MRSANKREAKYKINPNKRPKPESSGFSTIDAIWSCKTSHASAGHTHSEYISVLSRERNGEHECLDPKLVLRLNGPKPTTMRAKGPHRTSVEERQSGTRNRSWGDPGVIPEKRDSEMRHRTTRREDANEDDHEDGRRSIGSTYQSWNMDLMLNRGRKRGTYGKM